MLVKTFFYNLQTIKRYFKWHVVLILLLLLITNFSDAESTKLNLNQEFDPPENWYQVEVIIFNQIDNTNIEKSRPQLPLKYYENNIYLTDPLEKQKLESQMIEGALMPDLRIDKKSQRLIPNQELMIEDITQLFANEPDLINSFVLDNPTETQENKNNVFIPEFENVYENLESRQRNLNDTARSLNRRGFKVLLHEAWRFIAENPEEQNWVNIQAGEELEGRSEIEGSVRFYKSRFLHFEADLWKLKFLSAPNFNGSVNFDLPKKPTKNEETRIHWKLSKISGTSEFNANSLNNEASMEDSQKATEIPSHEFVALDGTEYSIYQYEPIPLIKIPEPATRLMLENLWTIKHSKRIESGKVYYLDHPEIGIIFTAIAYEPIPTNLDEEEIEYGLTNDA